MSSPAGVASLAQIGYGAQFQLGTGSPVTFAPISEIGAINFADYTVSEIDVTHLQSPNTTEEAIAGMIRLGPVEMTGNFIGDASQLQVDSLAISRLTFPWKITAPENSGRTLTIAGFGFIIKKETGPFEPNKKQDFKVSIRATGVLTYTVA
jgi:hypothetical protein